MFLPSVSDEQLEQLASLLKGYDAKLTVAQLAGLLTIPRLHANTERLEFLVHLAVSHCQGKLEPKKKNIDDWLNKQLGGTPIAWREDPAEDVFVTNIETRQGNRRIFRGLWEANDYFLQVILDILDGDNVPSEWHSLLPSALALLKLSDCVANRVGLDRWDSQNSQPKGIVNLPSSADIVNRACAVVFTDAEISELNLNLNDLEPFIFPSEDKRDLNANSIGHSNLERCPLVRCESGVILALPSAVSPAIRRFTLSKLRQMEYLKLFEDALANRQRRQVEEEVLREIMNDSVHCSPLKPEGKMPSLTTWLFKYDTNKHLHIILLNDSIGELEAKGFVSTIQYPEKQRQCLDKYLRQVAHYCLAQPDCTEGVTLIVSGGLGRTLPLGFEKMPDRWRLTALGIADLLMLAYKADEPLKRYLKCIKQKEWIESEGLYFCNMNSDYNFYSYWCHSQYRIVPPDISIEKNQLIVIDNGMVKFQRQEIRNLVDRHMLQTPQGSFRTVQKFNAQAYFPSLEERSVYFSPEYLRLGKLIGAIETQRGSSWFSVNGQRAQAYLLWEAFLDLYGKLVLVIEDNLSKATTSPVAIHLDFSAMIPPQTLFECKPYDAVSKPQIGVNPDYFIAEVRFPSDFWRHFLQPENIGERLCLRNMAKALLSLHGATSNATVLDAIVEKVLPDKNMRVLHLFANAPILHLLDAKHWKSIPLVQEDYEFAKLKLSEDCTSLPIDSTILSKKECNNFLNNVVDKIWCRLRSRLQQFNRKSVIQDVLEVHEAVIQDRTRWHNTAQAIFALYASEENVPNIAWKQEQKRVKIGTAARTILEMAVCECPDKSGRPLSRWELDDLLSQSVLLIKVAMDSDAIYRDLLEPSIYLCANGEYIMDESFYRDILKPFQFDDFQEQFENSATNYSDLHHDVNSKEQIGLDEILSPDFLHAFESEFGLTLDDARNGFGSLMDLAVERENPIIETTLGHLKTVLIEQGNLSSQATDAFVSAFSLFHRPKWDCPPLGYKGKDVWPWRFSRRLSVLAKPLLVFGTPDDATVLFGAGTFKIGFANLLSRAEKGHLPTSFFTSSQMRQYIGKANHERGHEFTSAVADKLCGYGWKVRKELQMTECGGSDRLGDIDVLAWKPCSNEIQIIECKRLQFARTIAEVADVCNRFQGEARDALAKHEKRVKWIKDNPDSLCSIIGFTPNLQKISDRIVTNIRVPMMYLKSLPSQSNKFVSSNEL